MKSSLDETHFKHENKLTEAFCHLRSFFQLPCKPSPKPFGVFDLSLFCSPKSIEIIKSRGRSTPSRSVSWKTTRGCSRLDSRLENGRNWAFAEGGAGEAVKVGVVRELSFEKED